MIPALNNDPVTTYEYGRLSYIHSGNHMAGSRNFSNPSMREECICGFRRAAEIITDYSCLSLRGSNNVIRITPNGASPWARNNIIT